MVCALLGGVQACVDDAIFFVHPRSRDRAVLYALRLAFWRWISVVALGLRFGAAMSQPRRVKFAVMPLPSGAGTQALVHIPWIPDRAARCERPTSLDGGGCHRNLVIAEWIICRARPFPGNRVTA